MNRKKLMLAVVILFIGLNSLLIFLDDDGKVARVSFIKDWLEMTENDMYETIKTKGVLAAIDEKDVYFDREQGYFQEFLVDEGAVVNVGDPLFTYEVNDYASTKADLERKQQQLTGDIQAIEEAIASMSAYQIPETDMNTDFADENSSLEMTSRSVDANFMKEHYLTEKTTELEQKEAELQSIQAQLSELESSGETITVESPYQGEVTAVSDSLDNPVVTLRDLRLQAEGELTETERMDVEVDMPVEVDIKEHDAVVDGTVSDISDTPETVSVHGSSIYPFAVNLTEEADELEDAEEFAEPAAAGESDESAESRQTDESEEAAESTESAAASEADESETGSSEAAGTVMDDLLPGYHADITITTNESIGATTVMNEQLFNKHVWKMTSAGLLVKQPVETGIQMNDLVEITKGVSPGEWIAEAEADQFRDGSVFMTPLKLNDIEWKHPGKYDNVDWKRYFVIGILSR